MICLKKLLFLLFFSFSSGCGMDIADKNILAPAYPNENLQHHSVELSRTTSFSGGMLAGAFLLSYMPYGNEYIFHYIPFAAIYLCATILLSPRNTPRENIGENLCYYLWGMTLITLYPALKHYNTSYNPGGEHA